MPDPSITRKTRTYSYTQSNCRIIEKKRNRNRFVCVCKSLDESKTKQSVMMTYETYMYNLLVRYFIYLARNANTMMKMFLKKSRQKNERGETDVYHRS